MHLSEEFGNTVRDVEKDAFSISHKVTILEQEDSPVAMAKAVGTAILKMAEAFQESRPDLVLLEGDRGESLAAAITAAHMNIAVAHVSGGDVTGTMIDESIRHAITKLAHIHFPGTPLSARRLLSMGEDPWRVHMVGTPGSDLQRELTMTREEVARALEVDVSGRVLVVLQHPVTSEAARAPQQMRETMEAATSFSEETVVIYPNADAGGRGMIKVIKEYEHLPFVRTFKSLPRSTYIGLLSVASVLIGNSSSAVVEAPDFGLPAVNVGTRQQGRERGGNLVDVGYHCEEIRQAIQWVLTHRDDPDCRAKWAESPYRDTDTAQQIAETLGTVELGPPLIQKRFYDGDMQQTRDESILKV
jgi:UDP-hydrolysing UDP-N-acetyl-D-glucosamine 2-epimerase